MVQVLRLLRRLPVAEKIQDIAIFINRELLPFLQELRESTAATFEQVTTNRLLGRDSPGTGDVEEISLDDTLEFTGSGSIQRAEVTGDVEIPAGSNVAVVPALPGLQSAIDAVEADVSDLQNAEYITYASNASLTAERVATTSASIEVDLGTAGQAKWNTMPPAVFAVTVGGAIGSYSLPSGVKTGDTIRFTITSNTIVDGLVLFGGVLPFEGMELNICLSDQSGGSAPGWSFTITDTALVAGQFRTPGQVQGTTPGPSYVMRSEEEAIRIAFQEAHWRIISGTAAQAITGDILVSAGNGSTRDSQIAPGVIVNADVNASAAIAQTKLGATTGFSVKASGSAATTSAEPIVTYSASANMSAERVLSAGTNTTISTAVANQISVNVAASDALIPDGDKGDITVSGTGTTWTVDPAAITASKLASDVTLAEVLSRGDETGANDIHVSVNQQLIFDAGNDALGDIQSLGTLQVRTASTIDMRAATGNFGLTATAGNFNMSGTAQLNFTASTGFIKFHTNGVDRFFIANNGSWQLADGRGTSGEVLMSQGTGTTPHWSTIVTASIADANVTLPKLATQAARTVVANNTMSTASPTAVPHTDLIIMPDIVDCFVGGQASTTLPNSALGWNYRDITGTGTIGRAGSTSNDGIYRITTGSNANDAQGFTLGTASTTQVLNPSQFKYTEFRVRPNSGSDIRVQVGYMQAASTATTGGSSGVFFIFDSSVSSFWMTTTRNSSTSTTKTTTESMDTSAVTILGIATTIAGDTRFYINGVLMTTHTQLENIPTTDINVGFRIESLTASAKQLSISRFTAIRRLDNRDIPEA